MADDPVDIPIGPPQQPLHPVRQHIPRPAPPTQARCRLWCTPVVVRGVLRWAVRWSGEDPRWWGAVAGGCGGRRGGGRLDGDGCVVEPAGHPRGGWVDLPAGGGVGRGGGGAPPLAGGRGGDL